MAGFIHPTAIIDPGARLGAEVYVGPYCIVAAGVTLGDSCWLQQHVSLGGPSVIGKSNRFFAYSSIGQQSQDLKYSSEPTHLEIGDDNTFREFTTVNRATAAGDATRIGSHNHFLAYAHIAHDCTVGNHVILSNNGTLAGHVIVEDHVVVGGLTAVHQFCRLGAHSMTGGCTKIVQDIPPYFIADGNPAEIRGVNLVGLQRRGFSEEQIKAVRAAYKRIYREKLNTAQAVDSLAEEYAGDAAVMALVEFVRGSQRGIVR